MLASAPCTRVVVVTNSEPVLIPGAASGNTSSRPVMALMNGRPTAWQPVVQSRIVSCSVRLPRKK